MHYLVFVFDTALLESSTVPLTSHRTDFVTRNSSHGTRGVDCVSSLRGTNYGAQIPRTTYFVEIWRDKIWSPLCVMIFFLIFRRDKSTHIMYCFGVRDKTQDVETRDVETLEM